MPTWLDSLAELQIVPLKFRNFQTENDTQLLRSWASTSLRALLCKYMCLRELSACQISQQPGFLGFLWIFDQPQDSDRSSPESSRLSASRHPFSGHRIPRRHHSQEDSETRFSGFFHHSKRTAEAGSTVGIIMPSDLKSNDTSSTTRLWDKCTLEALTTLTTRLILAHLYSRPLVLIPNLVDHIKNISIC